MWLRQAWSLNLIALRLVCLMFQSEAVQTLETRCIYCTSQEQLVPEANCNFWFWAIEIKLTWLVNIPNGQWIICILSIKKITWPLGGEKNSDYVHKMVTLVHLWIFAGCGWFTLQSTSYWETLFKNTSISEINKLNIEICNSECSGWVLLWKYSLAL